MSAIETEVGKFVKLLEGKKIEQTKAYIDKIDNQDPDPIALQVIGKGLQKCLVKKETTPLGVASALYFYKELFMRCQFDFMQSDTQFNPKIHRFVYDTCLYNPKGDPNTRGYNYFKDTMNQELTQQTKSMGNTLVYLALELMKCMGEWYPIDYFSKQASMFSLYYNKLKEKKVVFPQKAEFIIVKESQNKKFKTNYEKWVKRMDFLYGEEATPEPDQMKKQARNEPATSKVQQKPAESKMKTSEVKPQAKKQDQPQKKNQESQLKSKIPDNRPVLNSAVEKKPQNTSKPSSKLIQQKKPQVKQQDPRKSSIEQQVLQSKQDPAKSKVNNPLTVTLNDKKADSLSKINISPDKNIQANFILQQPKPQIRKPVESAQRQSQVSKSGPKSELPAQRPESKMNLDLPPHKEAEKEQEKLSNSRIQRKAEVPFTPPKQSISPHLIYGKQQLTKLNILAKDEKEEQLKKSYIQFTKKSMPKTEKIKPSNNLRYAAQNTPFNKLAEPQTVTYVRDQSQTVNYGRGQPQTVTYATKGREDEEKNATRKILKTQKPAPRDENQNFRKSIPKTQKKEVFNGFLLGEVQKFSPIRTKTQNQFKTLSDFRNVKIKRRLGNNEQINYEPSEPILKIIQKSGLGQKLIPFLPQYFEPVNLRMEALLLQALRIGSSSTMQPSKPFFKKSKIALRLIKSQGSYMLSIHNLSNEAINIGYSQALQAKHGDQFSCKIKIKGLEKAKIEDVVAWRIQPLQFADIPFDFYTSDPNFKFLEIVLVVDSKIINFILPITLLDQGQVEQRLDLQEIASYIHLYGRIMKSSPIVLSLKDPHQHYHDIPPFFRRNQNRESPVQGYLLYSIKRAQRVIKVSILIKQCPHNPGFYEIHAIYDNRVQENEDFAKVLLELLCLLLSKHH